MSRQEEVLAFLKQYLADYGEDPEKATPDAKLEDIGVDSLMGVELVFQLEERFGIKVDPSELIDATVGAAVDLISQRLQQLRTVVAA